jgi:triacylglycerol lipase
LPARAPDSPVVRRDEILPPSTFPRPDTEDDSLEAFVLSFPRPKRAPLVRVSRPTRVAFLHGFGGFSELGVGRLSSAYFRGVKGRLHARGIEASFVRVSPFASIMVRAAELSAALRDLGPGRTHLVAHSMGGLDARFALTHLGLREDVASLVTVATPHAGTPIADVSSYLLRASRFFEQNLGSVLDLTTARMAAFEAETPDVSDVQYACVVASPRRGALGVGPWLLPTYSWLRRRAGDNDGVVPVTSQRRGRELGHLDTDHWGSVGWGGFDAPTFYEKLVLDLLEGNALESSSVKPSHRLPLTSASW